MCIQIGDDKKYNRASATSEYSPWLLILVISALVASNSPTTIHQSNKNQFNF